MKNTVATNRGFAVVIVYVVVGALALAAWLFKPKFLSGDAKRADASVAASARVEKALTQPAAVAAASVVKIGEANSAAPPSPEKDFVAQEVPVALANLPPPDATALLEAEKRKEAVLQGKVDLSSALYADAMKRADAAEHEKAAALAARSRADQNLESAAAARLAAEREGNLWKFAGAVAVLLYLYVKSTHFPPGAIASAVNDIRAGVHPVTALDTVASTFQQKMVSWLAAWKAPRAAEPPYPFKLSS